MIDPVHDVAERHNGLDLCPLHGIIHEAVPCRIYEPVMDRAMELIFSPSIWAILRTPDRWLDLEEDSARGE
jgi:hypothetical protein